MAEASTVRTSSTWGVSHARTQADGCCDGCDWGAAVRAGNERGCGGPATVRSTGPGTCPRGRGEACHTAARPDLGRRLTAAGVIPALCRVLRAAQLLCAAAHVLPGTAGLLPAHAPLCSDPAAVLRTAAWLLRSAHAVLWLLWCPSLLPLARFLLPPSLTAAAEPLLVAEHATAGDHLAPNPWNCAIASLNLQPSCS